MSGQRLMTGVWVGILVVGLTLPAGAGAAQDRRTEPVASLAEVPAGRVAGGINAAEMQDLKHIAEQTGVPLDDVIREIAWQDNFSLAVNHIREAHPESFSDAAIVDANHAWIGFDGAPPEAVREILDEFSQVAPHVDVEIRTHQDYSERELQESIESVHYAALEAPDVRDATTSFDPERRTITTNVLLTDPTQKELAPDSNTATRSSRLHNDLRIAAEITVVDGPALRGDDSNSYHHGGEALMPCTSGFGTRASSHTSGTRGISTAGHCNNSVTDDGSSLSFKDEHNAGHGDFQWHTGPKTESDDFYAGTASTTETALRDVSGVGAPTVGQFLCQNGKVNRLQCQNVRKLNVCSGSACNLVQMGSRRAASGDSGGPVYYSNTAYGLHKGWMYDPSWPNDRDLFSRADRIDNALGIWIATN